MRKGPVKSIFYFQIDITILRFSQLIFKTLNFPKFKVAMNPGSFKTGKIKKTCHDAMRT